MGSALVGAPVFPEAKQAGAFNLGAGLDVTPLANEGADRAAQVLEVTNGLGRAFRLLEMATFAQAVQSLERPVEDARQFAHEAGGKAGVLFSVEGAVEREDDEA